MSKVEIPVLCDPNAVPLYATQGASGADVRAYLQDPLILQPGEIACIPTGVQFEIPDGYEIQIRPRSGLALKGITVVNTPGTIDSDYRGELKVILINHGKKPFSVEAGMRIAQIVVCKVERAVWIEKEELSMTGRASNGFGHTGLTDLVTQIYSE